MNESHCSHLVEGNYTKSLQGRKIYKDQCVRCFKEPVSLPLFRLTLRDCSSA